MSAVSDKGSWVHLPVCVPGWFQLPIPHDLFLCRGCIFVNPALTLSLELVQDVRAIGEDCVERSARAIHHPRYHNET